MRLIRELICRFHFPYIPEWMLSESFLHSPVMSRYKGIWKVINSVFFTGCPVWATPEGYTIENYGDKVVLTCETTGEFVLLECQGTRWIQKYPIEDETEISFPPCS